MSKKDPTVAVQLLYSISQAAKICGVSRSALYEFIASGALKTLTKGRRRLVHFKELEKFCSRSDPSARPTRLTPKERVRS